MSWPEGLSWPVVVDEMACGEVAVCVQMAVMKVCEGEEKERGKQNETKGLTTKSK